MSAVTEGPSAQRRAGSFARRGPAAGAVLVAVLLLHAAVLGPLVAHTPGARPGAGDDPPPLARVRTLAPADAQRAPAPTAHGATPTPTPTKALEPTPPPAPRPSATSGPSERTAAPPASVLAQAAPSARAEPALPATPARAAVPEPGPASTALLAPSPSTSPTPVMAAVPGAPAGPVPAPQAPPASETAAPAHVAPNVARRTAPASPASEATAPAVVTLSAPLTPVAALGAEPLPRYRAALPPAFEAQFRLRRGAISGQATWRHSPDPANRYTMTLQTRTLGFELSHLRSEGRLGDRGLEPTRFVEGRRGRDQRAVNFQREAPGGGRISFSGPGSELPLPAGVQDRLSWLLQLAAIIDAEPARRVPGAEISMWVVGSRGDADVWTFVVTGADSVESPEGAARRALALRRDPRRPWDTEVQVWLDPSERHLPLRAAWRQRGGDPDRESGGVDLWRESLVWR